MKYWLMKSEPDKYSFEEMQKDNITHWDGVRNYQAQNNMKAMNIGDLAFFYHSNKGKEIVGIVQIVKEIYPDFTDEQGKFGMVDVKFQKELLRPVTLSEIKEQKFLENMALVKQSRLSVMPVSETEWTFILKLSGNLKDSV